MLGPMLQMVYCDAGAYAADGLLCKMNYSVMLRPMLQMVYCDVGAYAADGLL